jgi:hypothetical protein
MGPSPPFNDEIHVRLIAMRETGERIESRVAAALVKAARKQCATQLKRILATTDSSLSCDRAWQ